MNYVHQVTKILDDYGCPHQVEDLEDHWEVQTAAFVVAIYEDDDRDDSDSSVDDNYSLYVTSTIGEGIFYSGNDINALSFTLERMLQR